MEINWKPFYLSLILAGIELRLFPESISGADEVMVFFALFAINIAFFVWVTILMDEYQEILESRERIRCCRYRQLKERRDA